MESRVKPGEEAAAAASLSSLSKCIVGRVKVSLRTRIQRDQTTADRKIRLISESERTQSDKD